MGHRKIRILHGIGYKRILIQAGGGGFVGAAGIVGMYITGCFMERWEIPFAVHGKVVFTFPCTVNGISHSGIASYAHFHDAVLSRIIMAW